MRRDMNVNDVIRRAHDEGLDPHTLIASEMFDVNYKEVSDQQRSDAKTATFMYFYGTDPVEVFHLLNEEYNYPQKIVDAEDLLETFTPPDWFVSLARGRSDGEHEGH